MQVKFSPQRNDNRIEYGFSGEVITATIGEKTDTFNFSVVPDGQAVVYNIETTLPINPIVSAKRTDGMLSVELLNFIGADATEEEKFPTWQEV